MNDLLQIAICEIRLEVAKGDYFALLRDFYAPLYGTGGLAKNGAVGGTTAASDRSAATMEEFEGYSIAGGN